MADSYYQIPTTPKLYISYPLWLYATVGATDFYSDYIFTNPNETDHINTIQINPSNYTTYEFDDYNGVFHFPLTTAVNTADSTLDIGNLWNFDFVMFLNHNWNTTGHYPSLKSWNGLEDGMLETDITMSNIVNYNVDSSPEYDGWSLAEMSDKPSDPSENILSVYLNSEQELYPTLGSVMFGKSYTFPQNCSLNASTKFSYGIKQKKTISGKTISTPNFTRPNNWITEPFGLGTDIDNNFQRRSGLRSWTMQFDSLSPSKVMPQNMMVNDNNYTLQDNHTEGGVGGSSAYNIHNDLDFFSTVVNKTYANHLPMVLQINKDDYSPSNFAIVRMNPDYQITQKSPQLYNIKVSFTEQI